MESAAAPAGRVTVLGSANMDLGLAVSGLPRPGETVLSGEPVSRPGGKGANQAVAAAGAGAAVSFIGCVGNDADGAAITADLAAVGVDLEHLRTSADHRSGLAVVMVGPAGENLIAVAPGANSDLTPADVDASAAVIAANPVLLLQLEVPLPVVDRAVALAADAGTTVVLNLSPPAALSPATLQRVDVLIVNREEAQYLLGRPVPDRVALESAAADLCGLGPRAAVLTAGGDGAVWSTGGQTEHVPAERVQVVDTTGAGDAFAGALAAHLSRGASLGQAVGAATTAGAAAVQRSGARGGAGPQPVPTTE